MPIFVKQFIKDHYHIYIHTFHTMYNGRNICIKKVSQTFLTTLSECSVLLYHMTDSLIK